MYPAILLVERMKHLSIRSPFFMNIIGINPVRSQLYLDLIRGIKVFPPTMQHSLFQEIVYLRITDFRCVLSSVQCQSIIVFDTVRSPFHGGDIKKYPPIGKLGPRFMGFFQFTRSLVGPMFGQ